MATIVTLADVPKILATIRSKESGGNYTAHARKGSASGAYQFTDATWRGAEAAVGISTSQYPTAQSAPQDIQDKVASAYVTRILQSNGMNAGAIPAIWYLGHVPKGDEWDKIPAPEFGNTETPRDYVSKWMKSFNGTSLPQSGTAAAGGQAVSSLSDQGVADAAAQYGYAAAYLKDPELGPILIQAAKEQWSDTKLEAAIANTNWYKTSTASTRQFQMLAAKDSATAQAQIAAEQEVLSNQASTLGIQIDPARMKTIAWQSLALGWNQSQITDALTAELKFSPDSAAQGQMGAQTAAVKQLAARYYLNISDETAFNYAKQIVSGQLDLNGVQATLMSQAKGKFPTLAKNIDAGITPQDFFDTYQQEAAKLLDVPAASIDLMNDPRYSKVLSTAGSDGSLRPMSISEFQTMIRGTPQWDGTKNALDGAAALGEKLSQMFGKVAA